jgi:hypothetical protein
MNFIEIEIGGKVRGLKFNQMAMEIFQKYIDQNAIMASCGYATFYGGLVGNCYVKRETPDFTFEDVVNWVDELYDNGKQDVINSVDKCFSETQTFKRFLETATEEVEELKKKTAQLT